MFVAILGVMVLALLGGAILGGVFDSEPGAEASPSPSQVATATPEPTEATPEPTGGTPGPSVLPSATAAPSLAEPTTFPDGFIARAEACIAQPTAATCDNSGAVNSGDLWILVSFRHGVPTDVLRVEIIDAGGTVRDDGSLDLAFCGSNTDCAGWTYFRFSNLSTGEYSVRVTRNGTLAAVTTFEVE
jgi:hypothetical protein